MRFVSVMKDTPCSSAENMTVDAKGNWRSVENSLEVIPPKRPTWTCLRPESRWTCGRLWHIPMQLKNPTFFFLTSDRTWKLSKGSENGLLSIMVMSYVFKLKPSVTLKMNKILRLVNHTIFTYLYNMFFSLKSLDIGSIYPQPGCPRQWQIKVVCCQDS